MPGNSPISAAHWVNLTFAARSRMRQLVCEPAYRRGLFLLIILIQITYLSQRKVNASDTGIEQFYLDVITIQKNCSMRLFRNGYLLTQFKEIRICD